MSLIVVSENERWGKIFKHTFERKKPEAFMQYNAIYVKCKDL